MAILKFEAHEDVLQEFLEKRRRMGGDRWDEVWEGVRHMVPSPTEGHQYLGMELGSVFLPLAKSRGLRCALELSLYGPGGSEDDYRNPDLMVYRPPDGPKVESAELVVEILSPGDESYRKLPFYFSAGAREVLVIDPRTRVPELFVPDGGVTRGEVRSMVLGVTLAVVADGPKLRVSWDGGESLL